MRAKNSKILEIRSFVTSKCKVVWVA